MLVQVSVRFFTAIQNHLITNQKSTTFIFMTDGQDTDSQESLKRAIQMLKLTISGLSKIMTVVIHVIDNFLNQVRQLGTKEGLFRYSTESAELQNNFNDMFEYAINEEAVGFLINNITIDDSTTKEIILKSPDGESKIPLELMPNVRPIHVIRALNLISPDNEESVQQIRTYLYSIIPLPGTELMEQIEVEQIKKEIDERMME